MHRIRHELSERFDTAQSRLTEESKNPVDPKEVERSCINDAVAILISKLDDKAKLDILNDNVGKVLKMGSLSSHSKRLNELILDLAREERKT